MAEKTGFAGWSTVIATWVGIVGAGIGGWTAIEQQQKAIEAEQIQAQKEYDQLERQFLNEVKTSYLETFKMFEIFNRTDQLAAREKIYASMADETDTTLKLNDVFIFFDFFDALQICVVNGICDQYVAEELFKPYAIEVWQEFKDDVSTYRTAQNAKFGLGLQWLAELPAAAPTEQEPEAPVTIPAPPTAGAATPG